MRTTRGWIFGITLLFMAGCGVTIQTGPEDQQRLTEVSDTQARQIRSQYADRLRAADPLQKAEIVKSLIDSISAGYIRYGFRVADEWRNGSAGRGTEIPDSEMREVVKRSNESQQPVFGAYEDVVDLAIDEIELSRQLRPESLDLLDKFRNQFYKVRSVVFYPSESPARYEGDLADIQAETERLSKELDRDIRRY